MTDTNGDSQSQIEHAKSLALLCQAASHELALTANRVLRQKRVVAVLNSLVGVASFLCLSVPEIRSFVGVELAHVISAIGIVLLVATPYITQEIFKDPPERFQDYAFYIGSFGQRITAYIA